MDPIQILAKGLTTGLTSFIKNKITNEKWFRDVVSFIRKDNYSREVTNMFTAAIADANSQSRLPENLVKELLEDPQNREEVFRWIIEGEPDDSPKVDLNLDPYMERYPRHQDETLHFFYIVIKRMQNYKVTYWPPGILQILSKVENMQTRLNTIDHQGKEILKMLGDVQPRNSSIQFRRALEDMLYEMNLDGVEQQLKKALLTVSNTEHSDPNWKYDWLIDGKNISVVEKPVNPEILKDLEKKIVVLPDIPKEFRRFADLNEIIEYGKRKQITIELPLHEFRSYAGEHLLYKQVSKDPEQLIMSIPPTPFPHVECTLTIGEQIKSMIWLQVVEILDDDTRIFSNRNQIDRVIEYEFRFDPARETIAEFRLVPINESNLVEASLLFFRYLLLEGEQEFQLLLNHNNVVILEGILTKDREEDISIERSTPVLECLFEIECFFKIKFQMPTRLTETEVKRIAEIVRIIRINNLEEDVSGYTCSAYYSDLETLKKIVYEEMDEGTTFQLYDDARITLLNYCFNMRIHFISDIPPIIKDVEILKKKLELLSQGETVNLQFISTEGAQNKLRYIMICGEL
ncbi:hypothetical protein SAMN05428987_4917 [Paenibacillus sp. CF095]|uniref:hypothetical protein n=1 Tax=Paenibacillus sp. CF095 TaxID=1881033 RepID=UPI000889C981|nr:hypothetical protein [Paenibacillus sp. CF095]SDD48253.1 hypothetical protein SAMN05428987_4917 [Paenibacillus sp. CF095]